MRSGICPKCGSSDIIQDCRIIDHGHYDRQWNLAVTVYEHPQAWLFKGEVSSRLRAWVCGACGFTELYVKNPQALLDAFRQHQAGS